jgi:hypothetical protein
MPFFSGLLLINIPLFFAGRVPIAHGGGEISSLLYGYGVIKECDCLRGPPFCLRRFYSLLLVKIERSVRLKTNLIIKNVDRYVKLKNSIELYKISLYRKWKCGQKETAVNEKLTLTAVL